MLSWAIRIRSDGIRPLSGSGKFHWTHRPDSSGITDLPNDEFGRFDQCIAGWFDPERRLTAAQLLPLVYDELKKLAQRHMAGERENHTLQPTALVHEAYLRLLGTGDFQWATRAQFFFAAAESMRRILIDHARTRGYLKRGGGMKRIPANILDVEAVERSSEILALDEAISRLEIVAPDVGQVVRLRFFGGLSIDETASVLGVSARTVKRDWTYARAWLSRELRGEP